MKALVISSAMIFTLLLPISLMTSHAQQAEPPMQGGWLGGGMMMEGPTGPGGWYCPWMGGYGGYHHRRGGPSYQEVDQPLTKAKAEQMLMNYYIQGNPNLKIGEFADKGDYYDATIVTKKEGALVERIHVDKKTGWFRKMR
jgi:hypothetical protein